MKQQPSTIMCVNEWLEGVWQGEVGSYFKADTFEIITREQNRLIAVIIQPVCSF